MLGVNLNLVGIAVAILFYGALCAYLLRKPFAEGIKRFLALPRMLQAAIVVVAVIATVEAQKQQGSTNEPPANAPGPLGSGGVMPGLQPQLTGLGYPVVLGPWLNGNFQHPAVSLNLVGGEPTVSMDDVLRGYRLAFVTNDTMHDHAMPTNAQLLGNVHVHGAASSWGRNILDFGDWSFPLGTNESAHSRLWWFVDGRLRAAPHDSESEISTGVQGALAVQGESHLWWAAGDDDTRVVGWENVFLGGGTNEAVNLQIVLRQDGCFETWSNDVGSVYARIDPNDWDGDGLDNSIDVQPTTDDGDCFGTGEDWFNLNCGNVLSAFSDTNGEIYVEWRSNVCASAYYWLQFTAQRDGTRVTITCDGPSNLGDLVVIANSNQVCTVPLLIGARYRVRSNWPVTDISSSDSEANISLNAAPPAGLRGAPIPQCGGQTFGPSADFEVERPISLELDGGGGTGQLVTSPYVGAEISSVTGSCCEVSLNGVSYSWGCNGNCGCSGYGQWWDVTATWEGYSKLFSWEEQCGCQAMNESNPEAWVELLCPSVIMKNGNSHTVSGSFNPPCETNATMTLTCVQGSDKIRVLSSDETWMEIQGVEASSMEGDVLFELSLDIGGDTYAITQAMTVAEVKYLHMESQLKDTEKNNNQPPFDGETACPFSVTSSPLADRHIAIPFYRVVDTNDFSVEDFSVNMRLELNPDVSPPCNAEWQILSNTAESGGLANMNGLCADFANPKRGGVIRLRSRVDGSPWTEGNIVLPLAGASIDSIVEDDLAAYAAQMDWLVSNYNQDERNSISFGEFWFASGGNGDYIGRPDSAARPTVWLYNQVNDEPTPTVQGVGFGAVMTWHGMPTLLSKVSNLFVSFGTKRIGVSEWRRQLSRMWYGTNDFFFGDGTSSMSWEAGNTLSTTNFALVTGALATNMWLRLGEKERRLWPNTANADNHVQWSETFDHNRQFVSPTTVKLGMEIINQHQGE